MRKKRLKWLMLGISITMFLTVIPGLDYELPLGGGVSLEKRSRGFYNSLRLDFPSRHIKYEWDPGAESNACWGKEGITQTSRYFYYRYRSFEFSNYKR